MRWNIMGDICCIVWLKFGKFKNFCGGAIPIFERIISLF